MQAESPSVRERRLARELRTLRASVQLNGAQVAERLGWSASKVSRIETSRIGISDQDLERLLELYGAAPEQSALLRALAPSARPRGWWEAYADTLSAGYASLIKMESGSRSLQCYCALVPHALLQTPEYGRQVIRTTWRRPPPAEVDRRVQVCRRRQEVLDPTIRPKPLTFSAVIDEAVLRRQPVHPEGEPDARVLRGQVDHLVSVSSMPNITVRVLPFGAGLPPVSAGSFSVLESLATRGPDVVYLENKTRIFFIEAEVEVHGYAREFELLTSMALSPEDSLDMLRQVSAELGRPKRRPRRRGNSATSLP